MEAKSKNWVILADVVGSRGITNRVQFEPRFRGAIDQANEQFAAKLQLQLRTWKGLDEWAAVTKDAGVIYLLADLFNTLLAPVQVRLAAVYQAVDIWPTDGDVRNADGPAFHQAAGLMQELKQSGLLLGIRSGNTAFDLASGVNGNLLLLLKQPWTQRQREVFAAYRAAGNQEKVASLLGITQQTVSKTLKTIRAQQVELLEKQWQQWLEVQNQ